MIEATTMSSKGQLTVPLSFHKKLGLTEGTKVAFVEGEDGNVYVLNASSLSLKVAQTSFSGAAEEMGLRSEEEADALVFSLRRPR